MKIKCFKSKFIFWKKIVENEKSFNGLDQYNRKNNNLEIQGIPSTGVDEVLEDRVTVIFQCLNIPLVKSDIEDCHRLVKSIPPKMQLLDLSIEKLAMLVWVRKWTCGMLIR